MTYELPDEVQVAAIAAFIEESQNDHDFDPDWDYWLDAKRHIDTVTPILAAHFEHIGAEKMREAAVAHVRRQRIFPALKPGDALVNDVLWDVTYAIRALPLPAQHDSQATNDTEEALHGDEIHS